MILSEILFVGTIFILVLVLSLPPLRKKSRKWSPEWERKFESFQPPREIMDTLEIKPGMTVGEVGAGNGRFAVKVAQRIGNTGKIYAGDIQPRAVAFMKKRCRRENITNMTVIRGETRDPLFPRGQLDMVYIINTYDELEDPVELMKNIAPSLKPGGTLAVIEYDPTKLKDHRGHATAREVVLNQALLAGFEPLRMETFLLYDNIYIFQPKEVS